MERKQHFPKMFQCLSMVFDYENDFGLDFHTFLLVLLNAGGSILPLATYRHTAELAGRLDTLALAGVSVSGIWTSITDVLFFSGILCLHS